MLNSKSICPIFSSSEKKNFCWKFLINRRRFILFNEFWRTFVSRVSDWAPVPAEVLTKRIPWTRDGCNIPNLIRTLFATNTIRIDAKFKLNTYCHIFHFYFNPICVNSSGSMKGTMRNEEQWPPTLRKWKLTQMAHNFKHWQNAKG